MEDELQKEMNLEQARERQRAQAVSPTFGGDNAVGQDPGAATTQATQKEKTKITFAEYTMRAKQIIACMKEFERAG